MNRTVGIVILLLAVLGIAMYINAQRQEGPQWQDGTYVGRSSPDERGYFGEIELMVNDGKIAEAEYEEMDQQGARKDENYPYQLGPQSHDELENRLVESQNPDEVDSISGATQTHGRFVEASRDALRKAETGDQTRPPAIQPPVTPMPTEMPDDETTDSEWRDGTYTARTDTDQNGYYGEIELVIRDARIAEVTYDEKDQEGTPKGEDYAYPLGPESEDRYEEQLLATQDPEQVDNITGATQTWERFKETVRDALEQAQGQGETQPQTEQQSQVP
ncbi:MAG: FMN-binding protein [Limnochordia bacterium]|nr:FMN-binding protein [Limnochordia bacterium]